MFNRVSIYIRQNVLGLVAIFIALTMGTAYATHPGGENTISTEDIQDLAVTTPKLDWGAVRTAKVADFAITTQKLGIGAVGTARLADFAVKAPKIGFGAVRTPKLANEAVTMPKIADLAVSTGKLADGAVTHAKLSSDATPRWAVVQGGNGVINRSRGTVSSNRVGTGQYEVIFNRDVTGCAYVAQMGGITIDSPLGMVSASRRLGNANGVFVETRDSAGDFADRNFHLQVLC